MALVEKNKLAIESNPELSAKVRDLWAKNADAGEFYEVLKEAGLDVDRENVADTVAQLAKQRGAKIAEEKIDPKLMKWVAGGGTGNGCSSYDDCDDNFKNGAYWNKTHCDLFNYCDQFFDNICNVREYD